MYKKTGGSLSLSLYSAILIILCSFCGQSSKTTIRRIDVIAHRGNHVSVPENTIASYLEAIRVKADYVEVDLRTTKDGKLVVLHDATVDRTTNGKGKINDMTWEAVGQLTIPTQTGKRFSIPLFSDVLKTCKGKINIYLDFKEAGVAETYEAIKKAGMEHHVVVYLNKPEQYDEWRREAPSMPLMTSLPENINDVELLEGFLEKLRFSYFDNILNPEVQSAARKHGCKIWLDVQSPEEGPETWQKALDLGVDGLQTDHPEALVRFLKQGGYLK